MSVCAWASHGDLALGLRYMALLAVVELGRRSMTSIVLELMNPMREGSCAL